MKAQDKCALESNERDKQAEQRDHGCGSHGKTAIVCSKHWPKNGGNNNQRQQREDHDRAESVALARAAPNESVNRTANRTDNDLAAHDRADAELFHVIVAANAAHQFKKSVRRNENGEPVAENRERCRDAEASEHQA